MELIVRPQGPTTFVVKGTQSAVVKMRERAAVVRIVQSASPLPVSGGGGGGVRMTYVPPTASITWLIPHSLGFNPQVTILDTPGNVVYGNITHLDLNTLSISFTVPFYGKAELA